MNYFDSKKHVLEYIKMSDGLDGRDLIAKLADYLPAGCRVLELGMGPGKDLDILKTLYQATGSDLSSVFLDLYTSRNPGADLLKLDAVTLETDRSFDCIYSNKVLHHLSTNELVQSFDRQKDILNDNGILFHTFWLGEKEEFYEDLRFNYYTEKTLKDLFGNNFEVLKTERYCEMEKDDSFFVILKAKHKRKKANSQ